MSGSAAQSRGKSESETLETKLSDAELPPRSKSADALEESEEDLRRFARLGRIAMESLTARLMSPDNPQPPADQLHLHMDALNIGAPNASGSRPLAATRSFNEQDVFKSGRTGPQQRNQDHYRYRLPDQEPPEFRSRWGRDDLIPAPIHDARRLYGRGDDYLGREGPWRDDYWRGDDYLDSSRGMSRPYFNQPNYGRGEQDPLEAVVRHHRRVEQYKKELDQMAAEANLQKRRRALIYSDPPLKHGVQLSWPLMEFRVRHMANPDLSQMLFFDISRNPLDPGQGGIRLVENDDRDQAKLFKEYLLLPFSPENQFVVIKLKCDEKNLDQWDVTVARPEGIRIIDIFEEIYKAYNTPLEPMEYHQLYDLVNSRACQQAFSHRCRTAPGVPSENRRRGVCRVDLLGNKTLFNGIFFNEDIRQYHFQLLEKDPTDISFSRLF